MIDFDHKHRQFDEFIKFVKSHNEFWNLRNDLGTYAGGWAGDDMAKFYADLIKICYDNFMRDEVQAKHRRRWNKDFNVGISEPAK